MMDSPDRTTPGRGRLVGLAALIVCLAVAVAARAQTVPRVPQLPAAGAQQAQAGTPAAPAAAPAKAPAAAQTGEAAKPATEAKPAGPRDPFDALVKPAAVQAPGAPPPVEKLLRGLRLVGVVWDARDRQQSRALVETEDGLGYYVRLNEEKFGAKVVAVERDLVRFVVRVPVPGGQPREQSVELKLRTE